MANLYNDLNKTIAQILIVLLSGFANAQHKKDVTEKEYGKWGVAELNTVSPDGKFLSYTAAYESGNDTLFIKPVRDGILTAVPLGQYGRFSTKGMFACYKSGGLFALNPVTGQSTFVNDVSSFSFSPDGDFLVYMDSGGLHICRSDASPIEVIPGAKEYAFAPAGHRLAYSTLFADKGCLWIIEHPDQKKARLVINALEKGYANIKWASSGKGFAFSSYNIVDAQRTALYSFNLADKNLYSFIPNQDNGNGDLSLNPESAFHLQPSADLQSIFISYKNTINEEVENGMLQVWNAKDKQLYTERPRKQKARSSQLGLWKPVQNSFQRITSNNMNCIMLAGNDAFALLADPDGYEPQFDYDGPVDMYIMELKSGEVKPLLKNQQSDPRTVLASPGGKYIAYYQDSDWTLYNLQTGQHISATKGSGINVKQEDYDMPGIVPPSGVAGWTKGDESFIIYDAYDLWEYNITKKSWKKLTDGRSQGIRLRVQIPQDQMFYRNYNGLSAPNLDLESGIILSAEGNDGRAGYFFLQAHNTEEVIVYENAKIDQILTVPNGYLYRSQRFDTPVSFHYTNGNQAGLKIAQTNLHHWQYNWGHAEPLFYKDNKGKTLKGVVYFPPGYNKGKKYPVVIHIYEQQFRELHVFGFPSAAPLDGFNVAAFTLQGYVVFLPDIKYEIGKTGASALNCTLAGVNELINRGIAEPSQIGLIGHSYGGYEANYIITQTDTFAAVVSGAGVADLTSFYLNINGETGKPDIWRMENQQWRIGTTPFQNSSRYFENSPINYVSNIKTPILTWAGKQDQQVNWLQGVEFYLALRRLNKEHTFLLLPTEGHMAETYQVRLDLFKKITAWFNHYLRGMPAEQWMNTK
jgi:dipeptidyl aminopeptidase/acylaminoacyl peptidase